MILSIYHYITPILNLFLFNNGNILN